MPIINRIAEFQDDMKTWRHDIHKHPETAFEEHRTAEFVATKLKDWGFEVHTGIATTGVVGVIEGNRPGTRMIGLRADMDALPMAELAERDHGSVHGNKMHACGHDGHTAMLLGGARYLAETRNFAGKLAVIFQPAEEGEGGGRVMVEEGLFERFPCETVYGLHNMPGLPSGQIAMRPGPMMAATTSLDILVTGRGAHAAKPHEGLDTIVAASEIVGALQTLRSRRSDPHEAWVLSITQFHAGDAYNILPETAKLSGTIRCFDPVIQDRIRSDVKRIAEGIGSAHEVTVEVTYMEGYPATVNTPAETELAAEVAAEVVGPERVDRDVAPVFGAEDFSYMLQARPGCYIFLGNGAKDTPGGTGLHNPYYDFNDEVSVIGASYWARLAERLLA